MPKPRICYKLLAILLLAGLGHALPVAFPARSGYFFPGVRQQSGQPPTTPDSSPPDTGSDGKPSLSDQVIQDVLEPLRTGVAVQNVNQVMSLFDKEFPGYSSLQQQFRSFFGLYSEVNFHYQILQVTADKDHGSATADIEMDALPYEPTGIPERRTAQMRFQLKLTPKGWKINGLTPADFFGPGFNRAAAR
jgi:hypothetical protein